MTKRTSWLPFGVLVNEPLPPVDIRFADPVTRLYCWSVDGDRLTVECERVTFRDRTGVYVRTPSATGWRITPLIRVAQSLRETA